MSMPPGPAGDIKNWTQLLDHRARTKDGEDIGNICAVNRDFIVVKNGIINSHYYYVPIGRVEGWDGNVLWLNMGKNEVKKDCARDGAPDPSNYYMKENPLFAEAYYPSFVVIPPKTAPQAHQGQSGQDQENSRQDVECTLCHAMFETPAELTLHIDKMH